MRIGMKSLPPSPPLHQPPPGLSSAAVAATMRGEAREHSPVGRSPMSIESEADLAGLRAIGAVVTRTLEAMRRDVRAGVTTAELDAVAEEELRRAGARATPRHVYGFPGAS